MRRHGEKNRRECVFRSSLYHGLIPWPLTHFNLRPPEKRSHSLSLSSPLSLLNDRLLRKGPEGRPHRRTRRFRLNVAYFRAGLPRLVVGLAITTAFSFGLWALNSGLRDFGLWTLPSPFPPSDPGLAIIEKLRRDSY